MQLRSLGCRSEVEYPFLDTVVGGMGQKFFFKRHQLLLAYSDKMNELLGFN